MGLGVGLAPRALDRIGTSRRRLAFPTGEPDPRRPEHVVQVAGDSAEVRVDLTSSSAIIPSIAVRILSFAHWLYATSCRSWLLSAMAVLILAFHLRDQSLVDVRRDAQVCCDHRVRNVISRYAGVGHMHVIKSRSAAVS